MMAEIDWDATAKAADNSIGAQLAWLQGLHEAGLIDSILLVCDYRNLKGAGLLHVWYPKGQGISAWGLSRFADDSIRQEYRDTPALNQDQAQELEPDA